jgi:hypothetical protein
MSVQSLHDLAATSLPKAGNPMPRTLLESGDHLGAEEFLRRYEAMPGLRKAELIDGVVYVPSPTRWNAHGVQRLITATMIGTYYARTPGTEAGDGATLRLDLENVPQPDVALIILPSHGGQAVIDEENYIAGAPELVCEISASTRSIDLNSKFRLYLRSRVREYVVWRVEDDAIDWFIEREGRYDRLQPDPQGVLKSEVFPGLWLDPGALTALDLPRALRVLEQGIATAEHVDFVARLARNLASARQPG